MIILFTLLFCLINTDPSSAHIVRYYVPFGYYPDESWRIERALRSEEYRLRSDWIYLRSHEYPYNSFRMQNWHNRARDYCRKLDLYHYEIPQCIEFLKH